MVFFSFCLNYKKKCLWSGKVLMIQMLQNDTMNLRGHHWRGVFAILKQFQANDIDLIMSCLVLIIKLIFSSVRTYVSKHKTQIGFSQQIMRLKQAMLIKYFEVAQLYSNQIQTQTFSIGVVSTFTGQIFFGTLWRRCYCIFKCDFSVYRFPRCSSKYIFVLIKNMLHLLTH